MRGCDSASVLHILYLLANIIEFLAKIRHLNDTLRQHVNRELRVVRCDASIFTRFSQYGLGKDCILEMGALFL